MKEKLENAQTQETVLNKNEFLTAISQIKPGLAGNPLVKESEIAMFEPDRVYSYNGNVAVSYPFKTGLSGAVLGKNLYRFLKILKIKEIKARQMDTQFQLRFDHTDARFNITEGVSPPNIGINRITKWNKLPEDFTKGIKFCALFAPKIKRDGNLTYLKAKGNEVISGDKFRLTRYEMKTRLSRNASVFVPRFIVPALARHNPKKFFVTKAWTHFLNDEGGVLSCRRMEGIFPVSSMDMLDDSGPSVSLPKGIIKGYIRNSQLVNYL